MSAIMEENIRLPGILQEFAELIGMDATLRIVENYGGVRLHIPKRYYPNHPLAKLIGHANAVKLSEVYGGEEHFDIARCVSAARAARDAFILAERASGATHRELALKHRMTERNIRNILSVEEEDDRQVGLF